MSHFLIFTVLLSMCSSLNAQEVVRLASGEWPPYSSASYKHGGVFSHIISRAFALEGIQVKYEYFPWQRSFDMAKRGIFDGTILWQRKPEREPYFYFSNDIVGHTFVFFHRKDLDFNWETTKDLHPYVIGATIGYNYEHEFKQAEADHNIRVSRVPSDEINFRKLLRNKIQLFPHDINVGNALLEKYFTPEEKSLITYHKKPLIVTQMLLLLNKKNKRNALLIERFNRGLEKLRKSGAIKKYLKMSKQGFYLKENNKKFMSY